MQLFMPEPAAANFGRLVWALLLGFYALAMILWILLSRPRLVIYNLRIDQFRPLMSEIALKLDDQARWAGDSLVLPKLGVQLHIDDFPMLRNITLKSVGAGSEFRLMAAHRNAPCATSCGMSK